MGTQYSDLLRTIMPFLHPFSFSTLCHRIQAVFCKRVFHFCRLFSLHFLHGRKKVCIVWMIHWFQLNFRCVFPLCVLSTFGFFWGVDNRNRFTVRARVYERIEHIHYTVLQIVAEGKPSLAKKTSFGKCISVVFAVMPNIIEHDLHFHSHALSLRSYYPLPANSRLTILGQCMVSLLHTSKQ